MKFIQLEIELNSAHSCKNMILKVPTCVFEMLAVAASAVTAQEK